MASIWLILQASDDVHICNIKVNRGAIDDAMIIEFEGNFYYRYAVLDSGNRIYKRTFVALVDRAGNVEDATK